MASFQIQETACELQEEGSNINAKLKILPLQLVTFSTTLHALYNAYQVTGLDEATETFLEVRDNTRRNALVYAEKVLPITEDVIREIGMFIYFFTDLDFDDWTECLDDMISGLIRAEEDCDKLKHLHNTIIVDLKMNEDKAVKGIQMLEKMREMYKKQAEALREEAEAHIKYKEYGKKVETYVHICTLGISKLLDIVYVPKSKSRKAEKKIIKATAKDENANIAELAKDLTNIYLIPSIKEFLASLEACSEWISQTKEKLTHLKRFGQMSMGSKLQFFKIMKKRATDISESIQVFLGVTDKIRNILFGIPSEPDDMNYVDKWFLAEMKKFKKGQKANSHSPRILSSEEQPRHGPSFPVTKQQSLTTREDQTTPAKSNNSRTRSTEYNMKNGAFLRRRTEGVQNLETVEENENNWRKGRECMSSGQKNISTGDIKEKAAELQKARDDREKRQPKEDFPGGQILSQDMLKNKQMKTSMNGNKERYNDTLNFWKTLEKMETGESNA